MSTLLMDERTFASKYGPNSNHSRVLKSRENVNKLKCNKSLKKKLKKYKLRKDGQEDPDIIDVSQTLINTLRIKSPNSKHFYSHKEYQENTPYNYLTKMVKLKKTNKLVETMSSSIQRCNGEIRDGSISLTSQADQDKKQTDAFKLLMDSRNKSIGSNSPGKEKCDDDFAAQDRAAHKEMKVKRIVTLKRMAEAKGSLKKLEIEEYREENIKRKMEDRAKRLKHMIVDVKEKPSKKEIAKPIDKTVRNSSSSLRSDLIENGNSLDIETPITKTMNYLKDVKPDLDSNEKKICKEDEEFLKKLSPSIRKKENMLCYFQKISKESDASQNDDDIDSPNRDQLIIKVKLKSKNKLTIKDKHTSKKVTKLVENHNRDSKVMSRDLQSNVLGPNDNRKKRKRCDNIRVDQKDTTNDNTNSTLLCNNLSRPRRNTKTPVKYANDFEINSSDEELYIFSPKKKKKDKLVSESTLKEMVNKTKGHVKVEKSKLIEKVVKSEQKKAKDIKKKPPRNEDHRYVGAKKVSKLAPIFVPKPLLDSAAIEAKQKFLQSGVPSSLKKSSANQTNILASDEFQTVVHIQYSNYINTPITSNILNLMNTNYLQDITLKEEGDLFKKLLQVPVFEKYSMPKYQKNVDQILQDIKKCYPKFPVYRTYHLLRGKSKGEFKECIYPDLDNSVEIFNNIVDINNIHPDKLNWTDKYKPTTEKQVIGNFESIRELKRWLVTWTENDAKLKKNKCASDSSDFYQSDTDSRETMKSENNLLIITGKVGTGKTLSVYAVAAELAIKVIEVNASAKRTGKIMLQDLQEATQSHKVDWGKNNTEYSHKPKELHGSNNLLKATKKRGRKKKVKEDSVTQPVINRLESTEPIISQDNVRTGMSLILIDDADIVFDQDDGFCYAISQLIQSSKRPVILVTSSLTCPHLQKFSCFAKIIKMRPFLPRMLGTWLDIMCLVDNNMCCPGMGAKTLDLFKGDIRRTINYLQFYLTSHKLLNKNDNAILFQDDNVLKVNNDEENSCMSWGDGEGWGDRNIELSNTDEVCKQFVNKESQLSSQFLKPLDNFYFWWNLPKLLNYSPECFNETLANLNRVDKKEEKIRDKTKLDKIVAILDNVSITDYIGNMSDEPNITSGPWQSFETDSVVDNENFATYNRNFDCINEISWELMITGISEAQKVSTPENKTEMNYPSMSMQRERDGVVSRHKILTNCLNPSIALDRRALALDYWPSCRNICRTEKSKTNSNSKRNNRFCHYLKSLNIVCGNEYFDNLGESLCFQK